MSIQIGRAELHTYNKKDKKTKLDKYNAALHLQMSHKFIIIVHRIFYSRSNGSWNISSGK